MLVTRRWQRQLAPPRGRRQSSKLDRGYPQVFGQTRSIQLFCRTLYVKVVFHSVLNYVTSSSTCSSTCFSSARSVSGDVRIPTGRVGSEYIQLDSWTLSSAVNAIPTSNSYQVSFNNSISEVVKPADLNRLFVRPETFNGVKPPPRQWLDQYEKAALSNELTDLAKVKYMATFLKESAYAWLTEVVPLEVSGPITWIVMERRAFRYPRKSPSARQLPPHSCSTDGPVRNYKINICHVSDTLTRLHKYRKRYNKINRYISVSQ